MAVQGLKLVTLALVDDDGKLIKGLEKGGLSESGIYQITSKDFGSKTANITGLEGPTTKVYGNNQTQDIATGASSPAVALDINNLNFHIRNLVLGNKPDSKGGYVYTGVKPNVAMLIETESVHTGMRVFFGFGKGQMGMAAQNLGTNTENQTREDDALTYTALTTEAFDGQPVKIWLDDSASKDNKFEEPAMMSQVFGGYVVAPGK